MNPEATNTPAAPAANAAPAAAPTTPEVVFTPVTVPAEQKSPELATTTPKTPLEDLEDKPQAATKPAEVPADTAKPGDDVVAQLLQATARAEAAEGRLKALTPDKKPLAKPNIGDHTTLEGYETALMEYAKQLGAEEVRLNGEKETREREQTAVRTAVQAREVKARTKYQDYDATIVPIVPIIGGMPILKEFIGSSPEGSEVAYHLGKNPAVLQQLKSLAPVDLGRQLFALETRLKTASTVKQSDAPEPIKPVGNRETVRPNIGTLAEKDINGYVARRNKQELTSVH